MNKIIQPFTGIDNFTLLSSEKTVTEILNKNNVSFVKEIWKNDECTVKVPWLIIRAENSING